MLEQKINDLTDAINALTQQLTLMGAAPAAAPAPSPTPTPPSAPEPEPEPEPAPEPEAPKVAKAAKAAKVSKKEPGHGLKHEDVQNLCLNLMRFDRSLKPDVLKCIASFNDAQLLQEVPLADLPALKAKLLKLKDQR